MSVPLTDKQYGAVWRAMVKLASATSPNGRLTKEEMVTIAREACEAMGWKYDQQHIDAVYR